MTQGITNFQLEKANLVSHNKRLKYDSLENKNFLNVNQTREEYDSEKLNTS